MAIGIRVTKRQKFLLSLLLKFQPMTAKHVSSLDPKHSSVSAVSHSLRKLLDVGYIEVENPREKGNAAASYKLSPVGEAVANKFATFYEKY